MYLHHHHHHHHHHHGYNHHYDEDHYNYDGYWHQYHHQPLHCEQNQGECCLLPQGPTDHRLIWIKIYKKYKNTRKIKKNINAITITPILGHCWENPPCDVTNMFLNLLLCSFSFLFPVNLKLACRLTIRPALGQSWENSPGGDQQASEQMTSLKGKK